MNVIKGRRRVLEAGILLLMTMLACTVLFAVTVKAWEPTGSYSLIIRKEFDFHNIPANVQALASWFGSLKRTSPKAPFVLQ